MSYVLKLKYSPKVLVDARNISPDKFAGKTLNEIKKLKILEGGYETTIESIFDVDGPSQAPQDIKSIEITIEGGSNKLCFIGYRMSGGKVVIKGGAGHFTGYKMSGGTIVVHGSVRDYLGCKMKGGVIEVFGDAGHRIGSKLHGEKSGKGMRGGTITIHGNAGSYVGWGAGGGTIVIDKNAKNFVGSDIAGAVVVVKGSAGIYPGFGMSSGRVVIGGRIESMAPSFYIDSIIPSLKVRGIAFNKPFATFIGDVISGGRGLLQISYEDNKDFVDLYKNLLEESI
ncbi:MAG: formylmethanofuran dehydrogenase subunit C [Ignisphaera sp.]